MRELAFAVAVVGALVFLGIAVADQGYQDVDKKDFNVTNESFTQNVSNWVALNGSYESSTAADDEAVFNSSGAELTENTDYEWATNNVSIKILSTSATQDGAGANITYNYTAKPKSVVEAKTVLGAVFGGVGFIVPFILLVALILGGAKLLAEAG